MMPVRVRFVPFVAVVLAVSFAIGCEPPKVPTGNLTGVVTSNGENVGDCVIALYNSTTKRTVGGKADETGKYKVQNIPLGNYVVSVLQRTSNSAVNEPFDKRIPAKFRDRKTSGFEVEIKEGDNQMDLKMEY